MAILMIKGKKILVTGGAGFIGSHLVDRLLNGENTIIVYDNFDDFYKGKMQNIQHNLQEKNFKLVKGDILNYEGLTSAMAGADLVFHEAAQCGIRYCINNPMKAHNVNVTGTLNVLMAAKQIGVEKVVFASSSGIFGAPHQSPMDETHPTNPNSPYGVTKLAAEKYCLAFNKVYELNVVSLRYFSVYGPRGRPDQVIRAFTATMSEDEEPRIFGDGSQTRDFTYVSDIVEANVLAAECHDSTGQIFNIGYGKEFTINQVFTKIAEKLGKKDKIQPNYLETYKGEFPHTLADTQKAQKILGWRPKVNLDQGLDMFVEWFLKCKKK
ncbi:MAG: GDP-mannose 4,6-dehydratase [Candidatus Bathyarchaeota archaeon]|nr:MAG: GDP-mannose 4,6-dehydratase [Candidatus Bathyarchaeota archaeon]